MAKIKKFRFIIKLPDPKAFQYQPRYYDPQIERSKNREILDKNDPRAVKARISAAFRAEFRHNHDMKMHWRRAIIFIALLTIAYYYLVH